MCVATRLASIKAVTTTTYSYIYFIYYTICVLKITKTKTNLIRTHYISIRLHNAYEMNIHNILAHMSCCISSHIHRKCKAKVCINHLKNNVRRSYEHIKWLHLVIVYEKSFIKGTAAASRRLCQQEVFI